METDLNKILSATEGHLLYLYSSDVNKHDIQSAFLSLAKDEEVAYITNGNAKKIENLFPGIKVVKPENFSGINGASRIVFDGESVKDRLKCESMLAKLKVPVLCTYPASSVDKNDLKRLVSCHDNMVLVTGSATVLSSNKLDDISFSEENIEKWIKKNLETIIMALLLRKPMSGKDIIKVIHSNFNTLVSPGRVYPILHSLNEKGLLTFEYEIRDKIYKPVKIEEMEQIVNKELKSGQLVLEKFSRLEL